MDGYRMVVGELTIYEAHKVLSLPKRGGRAVSYWQALEGEASAFINRRVGWDVQQRYDSPDSGLLGNPSQSCGASIAPHATANAAWSQSPCRSSGYKLGSQRV
jgi:hypothetical protein